MQVTKILLAAFLIAGGVTAGEARAQSYSMPGNDSVRQHPYGSEKLWRYCQSRKQTDPRCFAVTQPRRDRH